MTYQYPGKNPTGQAQKRGGRPPKKSGELSRSAIDTEVQRLLDRNPSDHLWGVVDILAANGVLSTEQLGAFVSYWTLRDTYGPRRVLDRLPFTKAEVSAALDEYGLPVGKHPGLYALGPVGLELARRRDLTPLGGYAAYPLRRVLHDVVLNEIVLHLAAFAQEQGWEVAWRGTNDAALYNGDKSHKILEPDLLLILGKGEEKRLFCLEYHNEDHRTRAERKVDKYEIVQISHASEWQEQWETDAFPAVLAVFHKNIVGQGYRDKLAGVERPRVRYFGKHLDGVLQDNLAEWINLITAQRQNIW